MGYPTDELHVIPVIAPVDTAATTVNSDVVDAGEARALEFILQFGVITGDTIVVTVEECDDITPSNTTAIALKYRLTAAVNTDSPGAFTAIAATGVTVAAGDDNKALRVYVNPAKLSAGRPYVRVVVDPGASMSVCLVSGVCLAVPRNAPSPSMVN